MKKLGKLLSTVLLAVLLFSAGESQATLIKGAIWDPADAAAQNPSVPAVGAPTATFEVEQINFDSRRGTTTFDTWLQGSNSGNINGLVWLTDPFNIKNSFYTSIGQGTFMQFTGTAYFSENVRITHDDGFWLRLGNTVYDDSAPTAPDVTQLHNAAGIYEFVLNYGAYNGFPEVLTAPGLAPVPEPGTFVLLGIGMFGLAVYGKRRMNKDV